MKIFPKIDISLTRTNKTAGLFLLSVIWVIWYTLSLPALFSEIMRYEEVKVSDAPSFSFPTREERFKYYMGDFYNVTLTPSEIDCRGIAKTDALDSNINVLINTKWAQNLLLAPNKIRNRGWLATSYVKFAMDVVSSAGRDINNDFRRFVMVIGDEHDYRNRLPTAVKTRYSRFVVDKNTGKPFHKPIIWPLNMGRHYGPIDKYYERLQSGNVTKWEDKKPSLIFRGGATGMKIHDKYLPNNHTRSGQRIHAVRSYFHANQSIVDVAFADNSLRDNEFADVKSLFRTTHKSMLDQLRYKYILSIEGNDMATGLKWQLASNSVVFMAKPRVVSYLMEDVLVPFVHYVPLKDDLSDLIEMVEWARQNDDKCKWIAEQATEYVERIWRSDEAKEDFVWIKEELGKAYYEQFEDAINSCVK